MIEIVDHWFILFTHVYRNKTTYINNLIIEIYFYERCKNEKLWNY